MNKKLLLLILFSIGLSAKADYTVQTYQPLYPAQTVNYPVVQQPYNQQYEQYPYQTQCSTQYQTQYPNQYVNPYMYPRYNYGYGNNLPYQIVNPSILGTGSTGGQQVMKNIGQSVLFSILRGY